MKSVESLTHDEATRKNIPSAEHQSLMHEADKTPIRVAYERRNRDLDPQLVWRGKDERDWSDLRSTAGRTARQCCQNDVNRNEHKTPSSCSFASLTQGAKLAKNGRD
jgi:hypothetical protein